MLCHTGGVALMTDVVDRPHLSISFARCSDMLSCYRRIRAQHDDGPTSPAAQARAS